ncbi:hypothetical protein EUGRSUZ_C01750 [Eucalyptus grandis]|uniref:Polygalacturonase n=2 Tax=Eucalyptus grandis TaxID=71139 RepID=A0A059CQD5_EUCGR|nr:hypothetical protein EUGRSUZ_C01750 [Eucalyptus grandis]
MGQLRQANFLGSTCPLRPAWPSKIYMGKLILGNITAPAKIEEWKNCESQSWILFSKINGLKVTGEGTGYLDGRGQIWWNKAYKSSILFTTRSIGVTFYQIENLELSGLTHLDSPRVHIRLENCTGAKLTSLLIQAPDDSPNTDGIAIGSSSHIQIHDSTIRTGDDCIAIKGGTSFLDVNRVKCGPGHGISVGSLGYEGEYETVEEVNVRNCEFKSSDNGARIKTWQGGSGYVRGIHFENIVISDARNPIIIDQNYCDDQKTKCKMSSSSVVKVSNVTFRNVRGTSGNQPSIKLQCAGGVGCTNIVLDHVKLNPQEPGEKSYADCENVVDGNFDDVDPQVSCRTSEG